MKIFTWLHTPVTHSPRYPPITDLKTWTNNYKICKHWICFRAILVLALWGCTNNFNEANRDDRFGPEFRKHTMHYEKHCWFADCGHFHFAISKVTLHQTPCWPTTRPMSEDKVCAPCRLSTTNLQAIRCCNHDNQKSENHHVRVDLQQLLKY